MKVKFARVSVIEIITHAHEATGITFFQCLRLGFVYNTLMGLFCSISSLSLGYYHLIQHKIETNRKVCQEIPKKII